MRSNENDNYDLIRVDDYGKCKNLNICFWILSGIKAPQTTDIEEREPVQIGIVATDANLNIKRTFSKSIRLSNRKCFNPNTFTVSHYPLDAIMKSKSEETVLKI